MGFCLNSVLALLLLLSMFCMSCTVRHSSNPFGNSFEDELEPLIEKIGPRNRVAVSAIYEERSGMATPLGNRWRDRVEKALTDRGVRVADRRELGILIDDAESFGGRIRENDFWEQAGARTIIVGRYAVVSRNSREHPRGIMELTLKAVGRNTSLIGVVIWSEPLGPGDAQSEEGKWSVFQDAVANLQDYGSIFDRPELSARMDRQPAVYPEKEPAKIIIDTQPGVYLYIIGLHADFTASIIYPNKFTKSYPTGKPLESFRFEFPPEDFPKNFHFLTIDGKALTERIKVVASKKPMDFSFLPEPPKGEYLKTGKESDILGIKKALEKIDGWFGVTLKYRVEP